jgi:replicative DNA helicase
VEDGSGATDISNVEAEAAVLGAMMISANCIDPVADRVSAEDFCEPMHGRVFSAILSLHAAGKRADPVTLKPYFEADRDMMELGGPAYLGQLTGSGAAVIGALDFANQVHELAMRRAMVTGFENGIALARDMDIDLPEILADADTMLADLGEAEPNAGEISAGAAAAAVMQEFDQPVTGVRCGTIGDVDDLAGPLRPKKMIVVGGRPGMCKTAKALSYARGAAARGHGILFVSLEMGAEELGGRLLADQCHDLGTPVAYEVIRDRRPTREQIRAIAAAADRLATFPLQIIDKPSLTPGQLDILIRRYKRRFQAKGVKLELVVIDYLQLMSVDRSSGAKSQYEVVSECSRRIKASAKMHGLAMMALAQLSRKVEEREDKRPRLADLRESGQIEQDADLVIFLYRAAYYAEKAEPDRDDAKWPEWSAAYDKIKDRVDFILAKRRDGKTGARTGYFFGECQAVRGSDHYRAEGLRG